MEVDYDFDSGRGPELKVEEMENAIESKDPQDPVLEQRHPNQRPRQRPDGTMVFDATVEIRVTLKCKCSETEPCEVVFGLGYTYQPVLS
jgi:hypothetical protein